MGGRGSGGARVGAGRKRKELARKVLHGTATLRERKRAAVAGPMPAGVPEPPRGMPADQREVWRQLAPHAVAERTLVPATEEAFRRLCRDVVLERAMHAEIMADGLTGTKVTLQMDEAGGGLQTVEKKAHTLLSKYTTMITRVDAGMLRFRLTAMGKPVIDEEQKPKDDFAEFDEPTSIN